MLKAFITEITISSRAQDQNVVKGENRSSKDEFSGSIGNMRTTDFGNPLELFPKSNMASKRSSFVLCDLSIRYKLQLSQVMYLY